MIRIASYNVENLFARPKAFSTTDWSVGEPVLEAFREVNALIGKPAYGAAEKARIRSLLVDLDIYHLNAQGAIRRRQTSSPRWAWLRKNRGTFDRQPEDQTQNVEIIANGRSEWIGWIELATEPTDETGTRMTAQVIRDVDADILGIVEAEDRPAMVRFNTELLSGMYGHVMLVDGNDDRGIDVAIMCRDTFTIQGIHSNVDNADAEGLIFSRDCAHYEVGTPCGTTVHVLINHFKSQSGGGASRRRRQAAEVRRIVDGLAQAGEHVVVLGDLNEGPSAATSTPANLSPLFDPDGPLVACYELPGFDVGPRPGTFDSCGLRNRLDYILLSRSLVPAFDSGGVFRKGLWGSRKTRPTDWETYPTITRSSEQASDHAAVFVNLAL